MTQLVMLRMIDFDKILAKRNSFHPKVQFAYKVVRVKKFTENQQITTFMQIGNLLGVTLGSLVYLEP